MKNRYEALLVLNTQGREDTVKDVVDRLKSEFQKEGAEIEQVQKAQDDEPVFLLRGQDKHAADLVEKWAVWASVAVPSAGGSTMHNKIAEANLIAEEMRRWPIHKDPD